MEKDIRNNLITMTGEENTRIDEPMSKHTTFKIGGTVDFFVTPETVEQLKQVIVYCNQNAIPFFVIGNGSNLLVSDRGYRGVIIQFGNQFSKIEITENQENPEISIVKAQSGVLLGRLGNELMKKSLTGFEFATGIPGTIGGAVMMNAGAYGGEIKDVLISATVMDAEGNVITLLKDELELGYRTSIIEKKKYIVLEAEFEFSKGNSEEIKSRLEDLASQRRKKQPLEYPSAGSTFKRPEGYFAGKLISDAKLMGYTVGGAQVSQKHAGFVINAGKATAEDVIKLTEDVKKKVKKQFGVELELEIRKIGFDK